MNNKALKILEFNKITDMLSACAASAPGKTLCAALEPTCDINVIRAAQGETTEAVEMIMKKGSLSLGGLRDITPYLKRVNIGGVLNTEELLHIRDFLYVCKKASAYGRAEGKNDLFLRLEPKFASIVPLNALEDDISRCIISAAEVSDDASRALRETRRSIRVANDSIRDRLNDIIHSAAYRNMLQDAVITIRNDRYCVPVKQEYKNSFSGMIHDQSATGATVFIEPISVVQLNNKIKELHQKEKQEIEKVLALLSAAVYDNSNILENNLAILSDIDFIFAKGELSIKLKATEPIFNTKGYINIKKARHPLLDPQTVVPTDIYMGKKFTTLLITGPNTGGKTVSLKTIGLFSVMGQAGLHIPAFDNSELTVFEDVFADIGDEQSIEQSLSTFSSHMKNIVGILDNVTNNSLVLLDELGAGTDPTEGAALAIAIIKYLHSLGIRTAVTTHYSELKVFALSTDGVENASCEFDVETLRPTYKLLIGVPGKSNAFAISQKLGLPEYIINEAKEALSHEDISLEDVITDLEISRKSLAAERDKAEEYRREAQKLRTDIQNQKNKLAAQREKIINDANEKAARIISGAKDEADAIIKEIRKMQREGANTAALDEKRRALKQQLAQAEQKINKNTGKAYIVPEKLVKGDRVKVHSLNTSGVVINPPDKNGDVLVKAGIMKITVNIKDLSIDTSDDGASGNVKKFANAISRSKAQSVAAQTDVRGMLADEAVYKVDKYLDDCYIAGVSPVTIIHGKGTGALRSAIQDYLRKNPRVKSYRNGQYGEGEAGVTVVQLRC